MKAVSFEKCCFSPRKSELNTHLTAKKVMNNENSFLVLNLLEIKSEESAIYTYI